ncbi:uracil-DNA glycosylase [Labilithrix luteola]|uniref:uracil-DNA glycosylase n=1 Tax=Labilithrix luteola TaxID=1391654 RepID=UPI000A6F4314
MHGVTASSDLAKMNARLVRCTDCPRLVAWREEVARTKRRKYIDERYWGKPVPGFGDPEAPLVILGLAPGAHGGNRTGRAFTGDRSGDFLYAALHRAGLANQSTSTHRNDGLVLRGVYITLAARCVPPDNRPTPDEVLQCGSWLDRELAILRPRAILALGAVAWDAYVAHAQRHGVEIPRPRPRFAHGATTDLGSVTLLGCYHVSQQNTQTGRLTEAMFDHELRQAIAAATRLPP